MKRSVGNSGLSGVMDAKGLGGPGHTNLRLQRPFAMVRLRRNPKASLPFRPKLDPHVAAGVHSILNVDGISRHTVLSLGEVFFLSTNTAFSRWDIRIEYVAGVWSMHQIYRNACKCRSLFNTHNASETPSQCIVILVQNA